MANVIKKINTGGTTYPIDRTFTVTGLSTVAGNGTSGSYLSVRWYNSGVEGLTAPYDGMRLLIKIPLAGVGTAGAMLSINGNNAADYHPLAYNNTSVLTSHYAVNTYKLFVYDASATMTVYKTSNTSSTVTGVWKAESNYVDGNSYQVRQYQAGANAAGTGTKYPILTRYNLTNKNGSYDNAYSRYYTDTYIDTSNGFLYAPSLYVGNSSAGDNGNIFLYDLASGDYAKIYSEDCIFHVEDVNGDYIEFITQNGSIYSSVQNQIYTFPAQSGTLALTSDLSGYLKLDGTSTMTGALQLKATGNNETNIGSNGIRWGTTSLPQDTAPQYVCTIDGFANGGRQKWASIADLKTALAVPTSYVSSVNGSTGAITNVAKTNANNTFTGSNSFTGPVGNTQTAAGVYLGLDTNSTPNANMAIVSANNAAYIDIGRPNVDYDFRIIKWNESNNTNAQLVYGGNASGTITIPQKTGTIALDTDLGTQVTFSYSSGTLTITPK